MGLNFFRAYFCNYHSVVINFILMPHLKGFPSFHHIAFLVYNACLQELCMHFIGHQNLLILVWSWVSVSSSLQKIFLLLCCGTDGPKWFISNLFRNCSNPKIKGAVVFHDQGPLVFDYSIRLNHSWAFSGFPDVKTIMDTNGPYLNDLELGVDAVPTLQYSFSGFLTVWL